MSVSMCVFIIIHTLAKTKTSMREKELNQYTAILVKSLMVARMSNYEEHRVTEKLWWFKGRIDHFVIDQLFLN